MKTLSVIDQAVLKVTVTPFLTGPTEFRVWEKRHTSTNNNEGESKYLQHFTFYSVKPPLRVISLLRLAGLRAKETPTD